MRVWLGLWCAAAFGAPAGVGSASPLNPGEVTIEFRVRNTGFNGAGFIELYSERAWDDPGCVFVRVPVSAKGAFASAGIGDVAKHFSGKRVRATGRMEVLRFGEDMHPCVVVAEPARIQRVDGVEDFTPTAFYLKREARGFTIMVSPELARHEKARDEALAEMERQLGAICATVPAARVDSLRQARIWMEWEAKPRGAAEHHPSKDWLEANGYNPDKVGDVEINNARNFVAWSRKAQPWMVMHELAHAYHHQTRQVNGARIEAAYKKAMAAGTYDEVAHVDGKRRRAYAASNPMEYFAELTEAYFGKNDFEPFDRGGLGRFDPVGYALMREVWGEPLR